MQDLRKGGVGNIGPFNLFKARGNETPHHPSLLVKVVFQLSAQTWWNFDGILLRNDKNVLRFWRRLFRLHLNDDGFAHET